MSVTVHDNIYENQRNLYSSMVKKSKLMVKKMTKRIVTMRKTITRARERPRTAVAEEPGARCWDLDRRKIAK